MQLSEPAPAWRWQYHRPGREPADGPDSSGHPAAPEWHFPDSVLLHLPAWYQWYRSAVPLLPHLLLLQIPPSLHRPFSDKYKPHLTVPHCLPVHGTAQWFLFLVSAHPQPEVLPLPQGHSFSAPLALLWQPLQRLLLQFLRLQFSFS